MSANEEVKFSLKVMWNKEETKILFAEVDSDFADILLSFLTLPLGTIVRLLKKHYGDDAPRFGSLNTLYTSLANLDTSHFLTESAKQRLLNPRSSFETELQNLKLNLRDTGPTAYFTCQNWDCVVRHVQFTKSVYYGTTRCEDCGKTVTEIDLSDSKTKAANGDEVFARRSVSFLVMDDLRMVPMATGSITQALCILGIKDTHGIKQKTAAVGFNEASALDSVLLTLLDSCMRFLLAHFLALGHGFTQRIVNFPDLAY